MRQAGIPPGCSRRCGSRETSIGHGAARRPESSPADGRLPLVAVGSHDTASAVAAVPVGRAELRLHLLAVPGRWSEWSLRAPVLTEASRTANFTNEAGLDGTVRYLRNVSGLWLLQECLRHWGTAAPPVGDLLAARRPQGTAAAVRHRRRRPRLPAARTTCRPDRGLAEHARPPRAAGAPPSSPGASWTAWPSPTGGPWLDAQRLSGRHADVVHVVGGGSRNELLCQLTADATGLPVIAGPGGGHRARQRPGPGARTRRRPGLARRPARPAAGRRSLAALLLPDWGRCRLGGRRSACGPGLNRDRLDLDELVPRSRARPRRAACWARHDRRRRPPPHRRRLPAHRGHCSRRRRWS